MNRKLNFKFSELWNILQYYQKNTLHCKYVFLKIGKKYVKILLNQGQF